MAANSLEQYDLSWKLQNERGCVSVKVSNSNRGMHLSFSSCGLIFIEVGNETVQESTLPE